MSLLNGTSLCIFRAMEFVQHFIAEVSAGEHSLDVAAGKAYGLSLRRYHNWIVRGVFNVSRMREDLSVLLLSVSFWNHSRKGRVRMEVHGYAVY